MPKFTKCNYFYILEDGFGRNSRFYNEFICYIIFFYHPGSKLLLLSAFTNTAYFLILLVPKSHYHAHKQFFILEK